MTKFNYSILVYIIFINLLISTFSQKMKHQKKLINIAFSINNKYIEYFKIALVSILYNSDPDNIFNIYVLIGETFDKNNLKIFEKLEQEIFNCFIIIKNLGKDFNDAFESWLDINVFYKFKIPRLCPDIYRIIFIDCDTLTLHDILELFTLNFQGNWILGKLDPVYNELDRFNVFINNYINSGIILLDLYNLRQYNFTEKSINFIYEHNNADYLRMQDQTCLNYVMHEKIGYFHPKFNMFPYDSLILLSEENQKMRIQYLFEEIRTAFEDPYILHFVGGAKPLDNIIRNDFYQKYQDYIKITKSIFSG